MRVNGVNLNSVDAARFELALPMRYRLLWEAGTQTGLRISDLLCLKTSDLASKMTIIEKKTGNVREVTLSRSLLSNLRLYGGQMYIWESTYIPGQPIHRQSAWTAFKKAAKRAKIDLNVGTHSMRKAYARQSLKKNGNSVESVRVDLGHKSIGATLYYLFDF